MSEALYRKYRPQVFEDVVGQDHIERTLKNAIDQDQVSHAYLFCGPRGTGKTTTARLLAKALLCECGPTSTPDGTCRECVDIANGVHPDVYELDAASRTGVENVRDEIIGRVNFAPTRGKVKVYIIDEVHMLSTAAFNALLKTLEEPPGHVVFILCTTDPQKVPETIQSRCQRFDFHRLSNDEIVARLGAICVAEDVEFEGDALDLIAHRAEGGMRNALTSLEQLIAFGEGKVTVKGAEDLLGSLDVSDMAEIITAIGRRDIAACFTWTAGYVETGADLAQFARDMAEHVRNMYVLGLAGTDAALDVPDAVRRELTEELKLFGPDRLARLLGVLGDLISDLRTATNSRLCFEIALTRMVRPDSDLTLDSLAERIEALEAGQSAMAQPAPAQQSAPKTQSIPAAPAKAEPIATQPARTQPAVEPPMQPVEAPAPAPAEKAAAPSASTGALSETLGNPAALQRMWRSVITAVKKEKVSYGVLFVNVKIRPADNGEGVTIEFPSDNPFAYNMARKGEVQTVLGNAFAQVTGSTVPFNCVQAAAPAEKPASASTTQPAAMAAAPVATQPATAQPAAVQPATTAPVAKTVPEPPLAAADDDRVPLDAYDSFAGDYADDGEEPPAPKPKRQPSQTASKPHGMSAPAQAESADSAPAQPQQPEAASESKADDMSRLLSDTMGSDITFEEIDG